MTNAIKITEATTLALHTMLYLYFKTDRLVSTKEIAAKFDFSENHLAKILQRLVKVGYIDSVRGPKGGFKLLADPSQLTLLKIYEAIEGPIIVHDCLLNKRVCKGNGCILDQLLKSFNHQITGYLAEKTLADLKDLVEIDID